MDHARHRAERRASRTWMLVSAALGVLVGAALMGGAWLASDGTPSAEARPVVSQPQESTSSSEGREAVASPRPRPSSPVPTAPSSTAPSLTGPSPIATDPVLLVGDSLAVGIAPYVDAGLGERALSVDAAEGRGTGTQLGLLSGYADGSAPIWVVSLGTNDNPEDFADLAPEVMRLAGRERCVVWFDVWRTDTHDAINATLAALARRYDNLHLVPWHATSEQHPEWFTGVDVHPSSTGYAVRGQMAIDAIRLVCDG